MKNGFKLCTLLFVLIWLGSGLGRSVAQDTLPILPPPAETMLGRSVVVMADSQIYSHRLPPPVGFSDLQVQSTVINVSFLSAGQSDRWGQSCQNWPSGAMAAYSYATAIWASQIYSSVPIQVEACWADLGNSWTLGYGGPYSARNFSGAPRLNTWYAMALANALAGQDLNNNTPELMTTFNSRFTWYFGTDGNTPPGQYDFVSVVLHEITHGLGFLGSMEVFNGLGYWGWGIPLSPDIYDHFTESGGGTPLLNYPNGSVALRNELIGGNIWFNGPNARAANGGGRVKLYAPPVWSDGSSYVHLDYGTYLGTVNGLMVYALSSGTSIHNPGPVTLGLLKDLGWTLRSSLVPDVTFSIKSAVPDQATAGQIVTFTVRIVNGGLLSTTARLTDTLPTALKPYGSPRSSSGPAPSFNGQTLSWQGTVSNAATVTITYATMLTPTTTAVVNQAQIDDGRGNVIIRAAVLNGQKVFLPITMRSYRP